MRAVWAAAALGTAAWVGLFWMAPGVTAAALALLVGFGLKPLVDPLLDKLITFLRRFLDRRMGL
jgi:uncharacterized membrane protein YhiD involved in acid resistance